MKRIFNAISRHFAILHVLRLRRQHERYSKEWKHAQTNENIAKLTLIQDKLYYRKTQFKAWGKFHPSCGWSKEDELFLNWLFPEITYEEIDIVVCYKHEAFTYYSNEIYRLSNGKISYVMGSVKPIVNQLKAWKCHNC